MSRGPFHGLRPVLGKAMQRLQIAYTTADPGEKRQIEMAAELLRLRMGGGGTPLLDPPAQDEADGEVWLGRVLHGERKLGWVGLDRKQFTTHVGLFGTTGAGKTTASASMLLRLMELGTPWIAIDPKQSLRSMAAMPTPEPVHVLTAGRDIAATLRFNPLVIPPGGDASTHIAEMVQLISNTWQGGVGIVSILEDAMKRAYMQMPNPTLLDVRRVIARGSFRGRSSQWVQSVHRILKTLTEGRLGKVCCHDNEPDHLDMLMSGWTIIETDGLTREEASFLVSSLLLQIHQRLQAQPGREQLKLTMLIDEAEQLLVKRDAQRESLLERMIRVSRESGLSLCVASQSISRMTPTILANLGTLIAMRAHHRDDVSVIARMLMLPDRAVPMLGTLGVGQAVCRVPQWGSPIHFEIPKLQLPKGRASDAMLARLASSERKRDVIMRAIEASVEGGIALPGDPADPGGSRPVRPPHGKRMPVRGVPLDHSAWSPGGDTPGSPNPSEVDGDPSERSAHEDERATTSETLDANPELKRLLRHIAEHPFVPVTKRYESIRVSRRKGNALRQMLQSLRLVTPLPITTAKGVLTLLELTELARLWLTRTRSTIAPINGGLAHAYWQDVCRELLERHGWDVTLEWKPPGSHRLVDVAARKDGQQLLIEVETGKSHHACNAEHLAQLEAEHRAILWIGARPLETEAVDPGLAVLGIRDLDRWIIARSQPSHEDKDDERNKQE